MFKGEIAGRARRAGFDRKAPANLALKLAPALRLTGFRGAQTDDGFAFRFANEIGVETYYALDLSAGQIERRGRRSFRFGRKEPDLRLDRAQCADQAAGSPDIRAHDLV